MNKQSVSLWIFMFAAVFSAAAIADGQSVYKWTDAQGVVHYSDKPPKETAPDLQTLDLPAFPAQDPAKIAADQAALAASTAALQQQMLNTAALQQQQLALAQQQAALDAQQPAVDVDATDDVYPAPAYPIYARSRFIPRSYRRNLYVNHVARPSRAIAVVRTAASRPAIAMTAKP
jgi:hypothetical protein